MAYYTFTLKANTPLTANVRGKLIVVDSLGAANGVDITPVQNSRTLTKMPGRKVAFKFHVDFDGVILQTAVDAVVGLFLSDTDVNLGFSDGSQVNVLGSVNITNDLSARVPVDLAGGVVNVTADNVGISNNDAAAVPMRAQALLTIVEGAPVAVGLVATSLSNDATLRKVRFRNDHASAVVGIGGAGVTLANAAIKLQPGDMWEEDSAAGAHWYAISDTAATPVQVQGLKP